jgi:N-acylneuraminate cytidylyltransferase
MFDNNTLVIIPARGGSKRIPKKNIKNICGLPMICWPLQGLSKLFSAKQIIVSTDDDEIKNVLEKYGLSVPFKRPKELSDDHTGTIEVATHALTWFEKHRHKVDFVLIVYPTAVIIDADEIKRAYEKLLSDSSCDSVFPAISFPYPIQRAIYENDEGFVSMVEPSNYTARSQDVKEALHDAGQFYFCRSNAIRESLYLFTTSRSKIIKLNRSRVVDIDTEGDFEVVERLLNSYGFNSKSKDWKFVR